MSDQRLAQEEEQTNTQPKPSLVADCPSCCDASPERRCVRFSSISATDRGVTVSISLLPHANVRSAALVDAAPTDLD